MEGLEYIRCALEPYGESVPRSTLLPYLPSLADPVLLPPGAFNVFPTSNDT
jgi:hypothetical protein